MLNAKAEKPPSAPPSSRNLTATVEHPRRSPDDHETSLVVQLLFRIDSTVGDDTFDQAEELRGEWQKVLDKEATGAGEGKKKAEAPLPGGITLNTDQVYHVEFSLPSEETTDKPPDKQISKFYVDIISMEYMAKVYYGYKSESASRTAHYEEIKPKLFRYFRQNGHTFALIEVEFEVWMTASVTRRLEGFTVDVDVYESADRLGPRAKADLKNPRKILLPTFSAIPLSVDGEKEQKHTAESGENQKGNKRTEIAANELYNRFLVSMPDWCRRDVQPLVPDVALVLSLETGNSQSPAPKTPPKATQSKKVANANAKEEQLATKRKTEACKTPTFKFQGKGAQLFLRGNAVTVRATFSPKVGPSKDDKSELLSTIYDGFFRLAIKDCHFFSLGQKIHLCPLTISIVSVEGLPPLPVDYDQLQKTCQPVYVEFDRFGLERLKTTPKVQRTDILWNEAVVTFMSQFDPELLREFLTGPPLEMQLHDRERGDGLCPNVYGLAKLDLYPFYAFALKEMEYLLPVEALNLHPAKWKVAEKPAINLMKKDGAEAYHGADNGKGANKAMPAAKTPDTTGSRKNKGKEELPPTPKKVTPHAEGRYQDAQTILRVRVSVAFPLGELINASGPTGSTPFGRCVLVFPKARAFSKVVAAICHYVKEWNADWLSLKKEHKMGMAVMNDLLMYPPTLSLDVVAKGPKVTLRQASLPFDQSDVLTGFYIDDGQVHIVLVEGLYQGGMESLEAFLTEQLSNMDLRHCSLLWDCTLRFSSRLYSSFGAVLFDVTLFCTMDNLLNEPHGNLRKEHWKEIEVTVRQVAHAVKLPRRLHQRNLFPTADQLRLLRAISGQLRHSIA
ncbi:hypothetical protein RvY_18349 [Ramazzottius varieornatus]|uniref:C2 domain-containing protein n=1 Tax=Ramazzottius varieornatus TaxID=947166 RepID=A0A1D1W5G0_RAMVA|nr:hypothetical protein RvY_18349 [Ramazzottius varieornatus]